VKNASPDDPINKKEWDNLSDYMRRIYKGGEDMKAFAKTGIYDPEKKKKAEEDVKALQKFAQAGDAPISKEDSTGLADVLTKCNLVLEDFFELLRDVPDEI
jgi:methylthioribose-1-phosphate isomerase